MRDLEPWESRNSKGYIVTDLIKKAEMRERTELILPEGAIEIGANRENTWEIIDNNGCVFSGTEDRMREIWNTIVSGNETDIEWDGDMKLVEIHDLYN